MSCLMVNFDLVQNRIISRSCSIFLINKAIFIILFVIFTLFFVNTSHILANTGKFILEIQMKGNISKDFLGLRPIVWGRLGMQEVLINGQKFSLKYSATLDGHRSTPAINSAPSTSGHEEGDKPKGLSLPVLTSVWEQQQLSRCHREPKVRDLLFLVSAVVSEIQRIEVEAHPDLAECSQEIVAELPFSNLLIKANHPRGKKAISVSIFFKKRAVSPMSVASGGAQLQPTSQAGEVGAKKLSEDMSLHVQYEGRELTLHTNGLFVSDVNPRHDGFIEVFLGQKKIGTFPFRPLFLKSQEPYILSHPEVHVAVLTEGASSESIILRPLPDSDPFGKRLKLSIPIYLELGGGYTMLDPVPTEGVRDRPTLSGHITTQPIYESWFLAFSGGVSFKSGSRIPWTLLGQAHIKRMMEIVRGRLQLPVGVGVRLFKAKIEHQGDRSDDAIVVPESVLGPDGSVGLRIKWSRTYSQLLVGLAPIKVGNSPILYDFNTSLSFGYRWTEATSFIATTSHQRVSFPTTRSPVHLGLSSLLLGVQHDME